MFDIRFFQAVEDLKKRIVNRDFKSTDAETVKGKLESSRSLKPTVFNVETTNVCNMKCVMCPRTKLMNRELKTLSMNDFNTVLNQISPHGEHELEQFWKFVNDRYEIDSRERSENGFYFYIVSRCLTLHGYGEPLLDPALVERVREATRRAIPTYFSCVPANLTVEKAEKLMEAGLTVLKVSIDALDDESQKAVRGRRNDFSQSFETVKAVIDMKKLKGFPTLIVPTMIALSESGEAKQMHEEFLKLWEGLDVFAYVKSQDNRWYFEEEKSASNRSHYEVQYCESPWLSLTVMGNGEVVPCTQDYNAEMSLGNIREQTLEEIWNGEKYHKLREWHVTGQFPKGHKCKERCDQKKIYQYLSEK